MSQRAGEGATVEFRLGQISTQLENMGCRVDKLEEHGKSMYGNGSGKKGYIERQFEALAYRFYFAIAFLLLLIARQEWHIPLAFVGSPVLVSLAVEFAKKMFHRNAE